MLNIKRALGFSLLFWVIIFVIVSILMFLPWIKESETRISVAWWILEIPVVLLLAKWYFKTNHPDAKEGFLLGLLALIVGTILDLIITIPLFISQQSQEPYLDYYSDWKMWVGFALLLALTTFAGYEFDATYTKSDETNSHN
ncbi:MAG: hypothetical protein HYV41_00175 [Candidatus Magasanikbacteria bacterium]|nr:hypothetical protein [Candidatus Magasanikbacteria bacterium]